MPNSVNTQSLSSVNISLLNKGIKTIQNTTPCMDTSFKNSQLESFKIEQTVSIKNDGVLLFIPTLDIIMIVAESNYSTVFLSDGRKIMTSKTLKHWYDKIGGDHMVRVHRSYLVNKNHARSLNLNQKLLILSNGMVVSLSRRNCKEKIDSLINF